MATTPSKKRKSMETERDATSNDQITTPTNNPARKKLRLTQRQKQALIDNLQLESMSETRALNDSLRPFVGCD